MEFFNSCTVFLDTFTAGMNIVDVCGTVVAVVVVRRKDHAVTCSTVVTDTAWVSTVGVVLLFLLLSA